jgi:NTE family protein
MGLCLSGGGYRAMVFHLGCIIRLNEAGLLNKLKRISSVSGGSITAGVLGLKWKSLGFKNDIAQNLQPVIDSVRIMAGKTIDVGAVLEGILLPGMISKRIEAAYDRTLFNGASLQDLPSDGEGPRFVINATNLQSGALFRFSKPFMADYLVGMVPSPAVSLAKAVAASSAFPPVLSPYILKVDSKLFKPDPKCPLQKEPFTSQIVLSDGGVYDNLGLETVWKDYQTVLVSDAGGKMQSEEKPHHDWPLQARRVLDVIDNQVRSLRKRQVIEAFKSRGSFHNGSYWGMRSHVKDYNVADSFNCPENRTLELAQTPTRLEALDPQYQERLINWGYAICDTAIRAHLDDKYPKGVLPYPKSEI